MWLVMGAVLVPVPVIMVVASLLSPAHQSFYLGTAVGVTMTLPFMLVLATPEHIDRWRRGAEGEKRTARALRPLEPNGWTIIHDLRGARGNRDHVAIAPSGDVFLLDTKAPGGNVTVAHGVLTVRWLEDPEDGYEQHLTPRMRGAAAGLAEELGRGLDWRPWVTPVVVIWGRWDGAPHVYDDVAWVPGRLLAQRLAAHAGEQDPSRHSSVVGALTALRTDGSPDSARAD